MRWTWAHMWITGRIFYCIYQNLCLKDPLFWKFFGLVVEVELCKSWIAVTTLVIDSKDLITHPYCGPKNLKLALTYTSFKDLNNGDFVLVRPHDLFLVPVWLAIIQSDIVKDDQNEFFKMVRVQWWVLVKKWSNSDERRLYENCWNDKWQCNLANPKYWFNIVAIIFSFPS